MSYGYSIGTVTGQYSSFLKAALDEIDKYPEMKGHYLVMDDAPIHSSTDIGKYINSRGYRYVYLPPYSPELNAIEQFWSVVKSKVKRNKFLEKESLMTRIGEACDSLYLSDFKGFVSHSANVLTSVSTKKNYRTRSVKKKRLIEKRRREASKVNDCHLAKKKKGRQVQVKVGKRKVKKGVNN